MTPFNTAARPNDSAIVVENTDLGTVTLFFPRFVRWYLDVWLLAFCALFVVRKWRWLLALIQLDAAAWSERSSVFMLMVAGLAGVFGAASLVGHTRVRLTNTSISRSLSVFGMNIFKVSAEFVVIKDIACDKSGGAPVIWIYHAADDRFIIEDFASVQERDWIAEELRRMWQNATPTPRDGGKPTPTV